ncbi:PREDICTED: transformer-2 protein homolog alpha isoform X2 [Hipposideros armiger]|uniref:Transformer-2 protein homolog beta n=1 Tax=Hipposideros armiger TaxID=186990 RepID=A0A8B7S783_HIPAR|nr:PREDICTED: transformer-2 protein homolog alpha isoform X2 [Hipposideros armiger]
MSDVEENNFEGRESRSQSKSPTGTPARVKSESRSGSRSPSRVSKHSESHSRSRSKSRSRSRRHSHRRYTRSRSHSHSHRRRSRSRSYTPEYRRRRSRSHSPMSNRRRHTGSRANPDPNTCLGVFGLSLYTTERDLREVFSRYGPLSGVNVVYDQRTGRSRGFAFVYFERIDDSKEAMERANGMELDGRRIRVDYSITKRAHTPTPGIYMGRPTHCPSVSTRDWFQDPLDTKIQRCSSALCDMAWIDAYSQPSRLPTIDQKQYSSGGGGGGGGGGRRRDSYYERGYERGYDRYEDYDYRYRRSPSPYYSRYRSRSRSRSYSPRRY